MKTGICRECAVRDDDKKRKKLSECSYCKDLFCSKHLPARLAFMRSDLESIKDKQIRADYEKEWRKPNGHPDQDYTIYYHQEIKKQRDHFDSQFEKLFERIKTRATPNDNYSDFSTQNQQRTYSENVRSNTTTQSVNTINNSITGWKLIRDLGVNLVAGGIVATVLNPSSFPYIEIQGLRFGSVGVFFVAFGILIAIGSERMINKEKLK